MARPDSVLGRLALAARPGRPLLRITAPAWLAKLLVAAGTQPSTDAMVAEAGSREARHPIAPDPDAEGLHRQAHLRPEGVQVDPVPVHERHQEPRWGSTDTAGIRVMVVDDHPMWRSTVVRDLGDAGLMVVAEAATTGTDALRRAEAARPDVVVLDLHTPGSGVEVIRRLVESSLGARVLLLSARGERDDVLAVVEAGASGYIVKSASAEELIDAVRRTAQGEAMFRPGLAGLVLGEYRRLSTTARHAAQPAVPQLTERETEVLRLVATGLSFRQIAERLYLSQNTVQNHALNALRKLQLHLDERVRDGLGVGLDDDMQ